MSRSTLLKVKLKGKKLELNKQFVFDDENWLKRLNGNHSEQIR